MSVFKFKKFDIEQDGCAQKVGTDSMVLGAFVDHNNPKRILDVGTGNGVLALMMAQKFEKSLITGVEIQEACCSVAQFNFDNSSYKDRLDLYSADFNGCKFSEKFDLIISNPPFFENSMPSSSNERTISRHQSSLNLNDLIANSSNNLALNGAIWLIVPKVCSDELINNSVENGLKLVRKIKVFGKPHHHKRDILAFVKTSKVVKLKEVVFTIRTNNGEYTDVYKAMTLDFHFSQL